MCASHPVRNSCLAIPTGQHRRVECAATMILADAGYSVLEAKFPYRSYATVIAGGQCRLSDVRTGTMLEFRGEEPVVSQD